MASSAPPVGLISVIVPTRERAAYLPHCLRTCLEQDDASLEILVLDNASADGTREYLATLRDPRLRVVRSERRLSMRDNFEQGLRLARGDVYCFLGDDDGLLPGATRRARAILDEQGVPALAAARANYFWPDFPTPYRNTCLLPRSRRVERLDSRAMLASVLETDNYYRVPCLYHGFVRRSLVDQARGDGPRFFLSSQVDMYSSIALSMCGVEYAYSHEPLVVNGASARSNGAAHFAGAPEVEKNLWKQEDDLGFLPGFEDCRTVGALIVESALRYAAAHPGSTAPDILGGRALLGRALCKERVARQAAGRAQAGTERLYATAGLPLPAAVEPDCGMPPAGAWSRLRHLAGAFAASRPVDIGAAGGSNVHDAARCLGELLARGQTGMWHAPAQQLRAALRLRRR